MNLAAYRGVVLCWFRRHHRRLPWRRTHDPYKIMVSEFMLQQTQVDRVIPKYGRFVRQFPNFRRLAAARLRDVLRAWSGLGHNARAQRLWETARLLVQTNGAADFTSTALRALPGIGPYTAAAIASIAFDEPVAAVDTNVRRVLSRVVHGKDRVAESAIRTTAAAMLPHARAGDWNQALMDIGALYCRSRPLCDRCPFRNVCRWRNGARPSVEHASDLRSHATKPASDLRSRADGRRKVDRSKSTQAAERYQGSRRFYRGRIVRALTHAPSLSYLSLGAKVKEDFRESELPWLLALLDDLKRDGLVVPDPRHGRARIP